MSPSKKCTASSTWASAWQFFSRRAISRGPPRLGRGWGRVGSRSATSGGAAAAGSPWSQCQRLEGRFMTRKRRLAVLLSGRGSNLEAIADAVENGAIPNAEIVAVMSDVAEAQGLARARERGFPAHAVDREQFRGR